MPIDLTNLKNGQRYRIHYTIPGYKMREMIAVYLGPSNETELGFSLRPFAGTQQVPIKYITGIWETIREIELPTIYRGEKRIY